MDATKVTAYRIKDWGEYRGKHRLFECAQSNKYDRPAWLPLPINLTGERYRVLMAERDGQAAFGVFVSLCELGAHCPVKGVLLTAEGALTLRAMRAKTGIPTEDLQAAISLLSAEEIGWLVILSDRQVARYVRAIKRERSGSNVGESSETEQAAEQEQALEQELNPASKSGGAKNGLMLAAAAPPDDQDVYSILAKLWTRGDKPALLSALPGATIERVCWLADRIRREQPDRPHGFMEEGIRKAWQVPPAWLERWRRVTGATA